MSSFSSRKHHETGGRDMGDNTGQTDVAITRVSVYVCPGQNVTEGISNWDGICGISKCLRLRGYNFV